MSSDRTEFCSLQTNRPLFAFLFLSLLFGETRACGASLAWRGLAPALSVILAHRRAYLEAATP
jgi:hypothetical protein